MAYDLTKMGLSWCWRMSWQRRSRSLGSAFQPFPLTDFDGRFFPLFDGSADLPSGPISSTEQIPMPYALRNARLTARVSAMRISAPRTRGEMLDGSASPNPTKGRDVVEVKTVALNTHRPKTGSQKGF